MTFKITYFKYIGMFIVACMVLDVSLSSIFAKRLDARNTFLIKGHYRSVSKVVANGRGGGAISYDLYIFENEDSYKIAADDADCFYPALLDRDIKQGDPIEFYLNDESFGVARVVNLTAKNKNYLSFECANHTIEKNRFLIPFLCLGITLLCVWLIYKKEIKAWLATD